MILFIIIIVCFFVIFTGVGFLIFMLVSKRSASKGSAPGKTIDLSALDKICEKIDDDKIDFWLMSKSDYENAKDEISESKKPPPALLKSSKPVKIEYTDHKGIKTVRGIIPFRINGYIDSYEEQFKEYEFYIDAFCLLRHQERSFHTNGISAAWIGGRKINLGDYLADLCRKTKEYEEAVKRR
ncbi:MAG: hypothetical protein LBH44_04865 [Treponema sp.]|jgi:flagellar basal body-associated protein FliL|nr:hypothetical protein [Treponema sp.]